MMETSVEPVVGEEGFACILIAIFGLVGLALIAFWI